MKSREYCCCAIPLINVGIYATLTEQFVLAIVVGTLSVATPSIVGAATPSFAPWFLAVFCYIAAAIQVFGFLGVAKEKAIMYRRYVTLNLGATLVIFAIAATWTIISAARHSTAQSNCETTFFPSNGTSTSTSTSTSSEGPTLCNIFAWVDVGIMGGACVFFAIIQAYFLFVVSSYGATQRDHHEKYEALNDPTKPLTDDIPMADRGDPWDSRASHEFEDGRGYGHTRDQSTVSTVMGAPIQKESYPDGSYPEDSYPSQKLAREPSTRTVFRQPSNVYSRDPEATPYASNYTGQPSQAKPHPGGY